MFVYLAYSLYIMYDANLQSFTMAWKAVCQSLPNDKSILIIPAGKTYLLKPISFNGPCKPSQIFIQVYMYIPITTICLNSP